MGTFVLPVAFGAARVLIGTTIPEIAERLATGFRELRTDASPVNPAVRIQVEGAPGSFEIRVDGETAFREERIEDAWNRVRRVVIEQLVALRSDLLWLHAGAVAGEAGLVVLPGASGSGKSTLATALCAAGWRYFSDDLVPIDTHQGVALPFPLMPVVRKSEGPLPPEGIAGLERERVLLSSGQFCREPLPISLVIFPQFAPGAANVLLPCPPAEAVLSLLQRCVNVQQQGAAALRYFSGLLAHIPAFRLSFSNVDAAVAEITRTTALHLNTRTPEHLNTRSVAACAPNRPESQRMHPSPEIVLIAAVAEKNRVIGKDLDLPWHLPDDLKRFKQLTTGRPLLMGRRTFESLLHQFGGPLKNRRNLVVTSKADFGGYPGVETFRSTEEALAACEGEEIVFIGGGSSIYEQFLPDADRLELTLVEGDYDGDAFFPPFEHLVGPVFEVTAEEPREGYRFITYRRKQ